MTLRRFDDLSFEMADEERKLTETKQIIKSLLLSEKNGLILTALEKEHLANVGEPIPYEILGFKSCLSFLEAIPDTVELCRLPDGINVLCKAISDESVSHLR